MDIKNLLSTLTNNAVIPEEAKMITSAVASGIKTNLSKNEALNIIQNISSAFGIKKPLLVENAPINNASLVNGAPVIQLTSPINHMSLIEQLGKLIGMTRPLPDALFNLGLITAMPIGYAAGSFSPEGGAKSWIPTILAGMSAAPKAYRELKLHKLTGSPYSEQEIINSGKLLVPSALAVMGNILARY